jgi:hypothetical protein
MSRVVNILFIADCFLFSLCTLGAAYPFESFSSAAWRAETNGLFYGKFRPLIDALFWFQPGHCQRAYTRAKFNLPQDMQ